MPVVGIQADGLGELVAGGLGFADFQIGVGQVLADIGPRGGRLDGFAEPADGLGVVLGAQGVVGSLQELPCGVRGLGPKHATGEPGQAAQAQGHISSKGYK